jgi:hypothetical protein
MLYSREQEAAAKMIHFINQHKNFYNEQHRNYEGKLGSHNLNETASKWYVGQLEKYLKQYARATTVQQKKASLDEMKKVMKKFSNAYRPSDYAYSENYQKVNAAMHGFLRDEYQALGISSLADNRQAPNSISEIITNMSQEKANIFTNFLMHGQQDANKKLLGLENLYPASDQSAEAKQFRDFISKHDIKVLSKGNSFNFLVENRVTGQRQVLKIDSGLDVPNRVDDSLRRNPGTKPLINPMHADRQIFTRNTSGAPISRRLSVTNYCRFVDALTYSKEKLKSDEHRLLNADIYFRQMCDAFSNIQNSGRIFLDGKLDNWLIDDDGNLQIADTKSIVYTNENGVYDFTHPKNENTQFLASRGYEPPEWDKNRKKFTSEKSHAFIAGRNLYSFLTGDKLTADETLDFDKDVFKTPKGKKYEELIKALTNTVPSERISLQKARGEANQISKTKLNMKNDMMTIIQSDFCKNSNPEQRKKIIKEANQLIETINDHRADPNDRFRALDYMRDPNLLEFKMLRDEIHSTKA